MQQFQNKLRKEKITYTLGLDTDVCIAFILQTDRFSMSIPRLFIKGGVYVNYLVLTQAFGVLVYDKKKSREEAAKLISNFLYKYRIKKIKKRELDLESVNHYLAKLIEHKKRIQIIVDDKDLEIISIYKSKDINGILTRNTAHFELFCKFLGIKCEKLLEDYEKQLRRIH